MSRNFLPISVTNCGEITLIYRSFNEEGGGITNADMKKYYEEYGRKVFLYLNTLCGDIDTAEELTQETFYQAIRTVKSYKGESSVYTWLCGIAKNIWHSELRRRAKHPVAEPDLCAEDTSLRPDEAAEKNDEKLALMRKIHALPEKEKEIVLLRATGELTFREIGQLFGKTENWARVTFYRAKEKLRKEQIL